MAKLEDLPNIGPKLRAQLEKVGIHTPEELKAAEEEAVRTYRNFA